MDVQSFPYFVLTMHSNTADVRDIRFISTLNEAGFLKEGEVTFPHKQSAFVKLRRENFGAPFL